MTSADLFTWSITLLCLTGTVLNVRKSPLCFRIWAIGNAALLFHDIRTGLISRGLLDLIQLGLALWGMRAWANDKPGQECPGARSGR